MNGYLGPSQPSGQFTPAWESYNKYIGFRLVEIYNLYLKDTIVYVYTDTPLEEPLSNIIDMLMKNDNGPGVRLKHPSQISESTFKLEPRSNLNIIEIPIWDNVIQIAIKFCSIDNTVSRCDIRYHRMEDTANTITD